MRIHRGVTRITFFPQAVLYKHTEQLACYPQKPMSQRPRILIVDDEASVLVTYEMILEQHGYEVVGVSTTPAALEALESTRFSVIVCDLQLETQHAGFDIIDRARQREPDLPAVLLTGYATAEAAEEAARKGITLVFKPVDIQEFLPLVDAMARR